MNLLNIKPTAQMSQKTNTTVKKRRKIVNYQHSEIAEKFLLNTLQMTADSVYHMHRHDMTRTIMGDVLMGKNHIWKTKIVNNHVSNYPLDHALNKRRSKVDIDSKEIQHSFHIFKKVKKLSLKSDDFFLFEYIEKDPLMLSNPGMTSRLTQYYYPRRVAREVQVSKGKNLTQEEKLGEFNKLIKNTLGEHGEQIALNKGEKIPLLG